ncbi:MAG: PIN domain-containing protein, partial [Candidatus Kapabacteria bacterium]|nr:PIN domain-containing protein [Candidatus Kapabacteria bacterium]
VRFVQDLLDGQVALIALPMVAMKRVTESAIRFRLDFDDAYHYVAAESYGLILVSLDADFDRTARGRQTPQQALYNLTQQ